MQDEAAIERDGLERSTEDLLDALFPVQHRQFQFTELITSISILSRSPGLRQMRYMTNIWLARTKQTTQPSRFRQRYRGLDKVLRSNSKCHKEARWILRTIQSSSVEYVILAIGSLMRFDIARAIDQLWLREANNMAFHANECGGFLHDGIELWYRIVHGTAGISTSISKSCRVDGQHRCSNQSVAPIIDQHHLASSAKSSAKSSPTKGHGNHPSAIGPSIHCTYQWNMKVSFVLCIDKFEIRL
jgi:hypothetical protein